MGKVRRLRQKLHITANAKKAAIPVPQSTINQTTSTALPLPSDDLFSGFNIDINTLKTKLKDDVQSVRSLKSVKSEKVKALSKKDKLKLRRDIFLRKIDTVNQMKKELKVREKRKTTAIIGDTNPLHDALPSLESLLKNKPTIKANITEPKKKRGIEKAKKRKKDAIQGLKIYQSILNNKHFQKNPLDAISQHIQTMVSQEKDKLKK